jgi:predicted Zn-dependent protease
MIPRKKRTLSVGLTTSNQDVYTVPERFNADVSSIIISNASSSSVTFSLDWYQSSSTTYFTIAEAVTMVPNSILQITEYPLYLEKNDLIRGLASANSSITVTIASEEYFEATRFN